MKVYIVAQQNYYEVDSYYDDYYIESDIMACYRTKEEAVSRAITECDEWYSNDPIKREHIEESEQYGRYYIGVDDDVVFVVIEMEVE